MVNVVFLSKNWWKHLGVRIFLKSAKTAKMEQVTAVQTTAGKEPGEEGSLGWRRRRASTHTVQ